MVTQQHKPKRKRIEERLDELTESSHRKLRHLFRTPEFQPEMTHRIKHILDDNGIEYEVKDYNSVFFEVDLSYIIRKEESDILLQSENDSIMFKALNTQMDILGNRVIVFLKPT